MSTKKDFKNENENKEELLEMRRLTVSAVYMNEGYRKNDYASRIMLLGKWVRKCGFNEGEKLTISIYQNRIVVEKEDPNTIDTKLLARVQNESSRLLRKKIKAMVHPEVFEQLRFVNGEIKIK
ncbi:type I toxin-antitoxin system SymE family toxin [Elizabethkingia miricola]|nr:type I addiction module toxin, SymE family [Elizabethkingia miricola]NHQ70094.1 type I addiction module toxin, SymE family [Elizabethkingia miricola]NHQ79751.1 type I addiction module toxin, SymE family [Elizabethkingia miricola]PSL89281.1 type I addiction module toxin, SymE family [Elizabethkingia miricola]QHQ85403.1 type I toxin-antitoxin system SymE family toxin [Elizabethkingia miricola]